MGFSKSGADERERIPVDEFRSNMDRSVPPVFSKVMVSPSIESEALMSKDMDEFSVT